MSDRDVRFELGFRGGTRTTGEIPASEWAKLQTALGGGGGVVELSAGDQTWWVRVEEIVFAHRHEREKRLGFS